MVLVFQICIAIENHLKSMRFILKACSVHFLARG